MKKSKVILADKSVLVLKGLKSICTEIGNIEVVKELSNWDHIIKVANKKQANFLVFNYNLLPENSYHNLRGYFNENIDLNFIVYGNNSIPDNIKAQCITSFLSNDNELHIYNTLKNNFTSSNKKEKKAMPAGRQESSTLSKREEAVVRCIALGMTNKEIAEHLFISTHTVIAHRKNITRKLAIKTVSGLTVYAILNKLVKFEEIGKQ